MINGTGPGALRGMSDARPPEVVSARIRLRAPLGHPMLASLPRLIRASPSPVVRSFEPSLHALREEHASRKLGREFAVTRLLEVLFVHALRAHIDALGWTDQGWFRMLADPVLRNPLAEASCATTTVAGFAAAAGRIPSADLCAVHAARGRATLRVPPSDEGPARSGAAAGGETDLGIASRRRAGMPRVRDSAAPSGVSSGSRQRSTGGPSTGGRSPGPIGGRAEPPQAFRNQRRIRSSPCGTGPSPRSASVIAAPRQSPFRPRSPPAPASARPPRRLRGRGRPRWAPPAARRRRDRGARTLARAPLPRRPAQELVGALGERVSGETIGKPPLLDERALGRVRCAHSGER